ncbi:hypothetical protein DCAR_0935406 [Daucus carota subsp. sativus]|uniref:Uncharacterized protein n=1 Tax=Daucus carota subsp. sativus TaxID=79200 RepID=A0A175YH14_DAUCS|nr:PREDICTED: bZIP transcription factor 53-like [Daucus carota subsp. sativus]WOH15860.1 hypothetical protein DCAR_0935406 [Daucus carota subsp. sativus]
MDHAKRPSSGSEEDDRYMMITEDKKRKRMISNRESARRSRMKRQQHMQDLNNQIMFYKNRRTEINQSISNFTEQFTAIENQNRIMRAQKEELRKRLEAAELVTSYLDAAKGYPVNTAEEPWYYNLWQPSQSMPIMTSAEFFQF